MQSQPLGKDPDAGKDWRQEEKGTAEDEMVGWHHQFNGHEYEQAPGNDGGQGGLECCSEWGHRESDYTEQLKCTELHWTYLPFIIFSLPFWWYEWLLLSFHFNLNHLQNVLWFRSIDNYAIVGKCFYLTFIVKEYFHWLQSSRLAILFVIILRWFHVFWSSLFRRRTHCWFVLLLFSHSVVSDSFWSYGL